MHDEKKITKKVDSKENEEDEWSTAKPVNNEDPSGINEYYRKLDAGEL